MTLTDSPASLVRSLKGAPLACLFILLLSGDAMRAGELCQATGYSPNSITAALRLLAHLNLIARTPDGWRAPPSLRTALLHGAGASDNFANREPSASIRESSPSGGEDINSESFRIFPPPPGSASQIAPITPGQRVIPVNHELPAANDLVSRILDATRLLFGERLHGPPSRYPDVRLLLAAIAEAYVRRNSLRTPARVAYANLKRGIDPGEEFLSDPLAYLPAEFLAATGLACTPPADSDLIEEDRPPDPESAEDPLPAVHPSLEQPADVSGRRSAAQAWEVAMRALRSELSRSIWRTYLEACRLAAFDPETATFTISVPGNQTRLWLEERLTTHLTHLLNGICDRPCSVRFEVERTRA